MAYFEGEPGVPLEFRDYIVSAGTLVLTISLSGYFNSLHDPIPQTSDSGINSYQTLIPELSSFLSPNTPEACNGGGARPCAMLIRSQPVLESVSVNAKPGQRRVNWPLESFEDNPGHDVLIDCYEPAGQKVHALDGSSASSVWYRVIVPPQHVENKQVHREMVAGTFPSVLYGGRTALYGWAAAEWFGETKPDSGIQPC